ncbi:MAG: 4-(cytidine 5'-diphospho)-2-C-methyl-D-erythritol kinase [Phycisphaerales bacterium]|jgi:4-diphosphocytidyl-2-C-methyl-D-erythritol kinase|nr:4-(cytidine 5'-diphospho)-2-C-methyl-D-erythritol kinase [Phycisphaerales bacterium]MBT7172024.1 4-(cytidine 5'-diphospho)-2-C-methyl-D-erythritol kinase [Phycisphaerales bacterium]
MTTTTLQDTPLELLAPAKINLNLHVGPLRPDGFHPLDSIVAKISLADHITLTPRTDGEITFRCDGFDAGPDEDNLAVRAATLLAGAMAKRGWTVPGVDITLEKHIPAGGGLGGGSSDAATVLRGCAQVWGAEFSFDELSALGVELGSDVPVFLMGGAARMECRGGVLSPITVSDFAAVLILPDIHSSTPAVYRAFDDAPEELAPQLSADFFATTPVEDWPAHLHNSLAEPAMIVAPELRTIKAEFEAATGLPVQITGSGSGMFILTSSQTAAEAILTNLPPNLATLCQVVEHDE